MFNEGRYLHESGFMRQVNEDGTIFLSPNTPAFVNIKDFFDTTKWTKIEAQAE